MATHSVPAGRVYRAPDMLADPHFAAREAILAVPHPEHGTVRMQNAFPKLSDTPSSVRRPAPAIPGQDNAEVLSGIGVSAEELRELEQQGVI